MRAITFPKTGPNEWSNRETGVRIAAAGRQGYEVRRPMPNAVGWQHAAYRPTLASARKRAAWVAEFDVRPDLAEAHTEALAEYAERNAKGGDESTIHYWTPEFELAECELNVFATAYTYGSPKWSEVTCVLCHAARGC